MTMVDYEVIKFKPYGGIISEVLRIDGATYYVTAVHTSTGGDGSVYSVTSHVIDPIHGDDDFFEARAAAVRTTNADITQDELAEATPRMPDQVLEEFHLRKLAADVMTEMCDRDIRDIDELIECTDDSVRKAVLAFNHDKVAEIIRESERAFTEWATACNGDDGGTTAKGERHDN